MFLVICIHDYHPWNVTRVHWLLLDLMSYLPLFVLGLLKCWNRLIDLCWRMNLVTSLWAVCWSTFATFFFFEGIYLILYLLIGYSLRCCRNWLNSSSSVINTELIHVHLCVFSLSLSIPPLLYCTQDGELSSVGRCWKSRSFKIALVILCIVLIVAIVVVIVILLIIFISEFCSTTYY